MYKPINKGGLNCINMEKFLHAIRLNWMHRYITLNHNDFWTSLLDYYLDTTWTPHPQIGKKSWNGVPRNSINL